MDKLLDILNDDHMVRMWKMSDGQIAVCIDESHYGSGDTVDEAIESVDMETV